VIPQIPGVAEHRTHKDHIELVLDAESTPQQVLEALVATGIPMERFEVSTPSLHEIFLETVGGESHAE